MFKTRGGVKGRLKQRMVSLREGIKETYLGKLSQMCEPQNFCEI